MTRKFPLFGIAAVAAVAMACGDQASTPTAPTPAVSSDTAAAAADGSTLKATAPAPQQPANGTTADSVAPNLVIANATLKYLGDVALAGSIRFKINVETPAGVQVHAAWATPQAGTDLSAHRVPAGVLQPDTTYRWRTRAELGSSVGPWSSYWTFTTPKSGSGLASYQNATELWDNLTDGKTIGTLAGGAQFVAGKGVLLPSFESHVTYTLQSTLTSGFMKFLVEGLESDSNGGKTKVVSMQQGYTDLTDNPYRFNVEKRGDDHVDVGKYRMRIITGNAAEGGFFDSPRLLPTSPLVASKVYWHRVTWGGGVVTLNVRELSPTGVPLVSYQYSYEGTYRPSPHVVHIGAPVPRGGPVDASVPGLIVRHFYVSQGGRWPGFADIASALGLNGPGQ